MVPGPQDIPLIDWGINLGLATLGGIVRFLKEWRDNLGLWNRHKASIEGSINAMYAVFAATLALLLLKAWKVDPFYITFACGLMGHMGPEGVSFLREILTNGFRSKATASTP